MKKPTIFFLLLVFQLSGFGSGQLSDSFRILPKPQKVELTSGAGLYYSELKFLTSDAKTPVPVTGNLISCLPRSENKGKGIHLQLSHSADLSESDEGYVLQVKDEGIYIHARSKKGLFYACQTLEQLMEDSRDNDVKIPSMKITDFPEIAYRAIHLDLKHHLDATNYYYRLIDRLASIKINAIIVEFEDKLRYRKEPEVGAKHALSVEEFVAISKYAKERNIEISPLVQGLGHASFILKHDKYKSLRDDPSSDWVFDPLNPETYKVQFALYEDAIAATPNGRYLHIGGDEVGDLGKSKLSKESGKSPFELQMYWLKKVCEFAEKHNRIPIFWDDMVFKLSGLHETTWERKLKEEQVLDLWKKNKPMLDKNLSLFPANCVYMRWEYDHPKITGNQLAIDWFKERNLSVMGATAAQQMWPMLPRSSSNFQSIKDFCQLTSEKKMNGILCTVWDDSSPHFETVWRGLYDFGLFSWNYEDISKAAAHSMFRHRFYAPQMGSEYFEFQDMLEEAAGVWDKVLNTSGYRGKYDETNKLIELPGTGSDQNWSLKYKDKIEMAKKSIDLYPQIKSRLVKSGELARRNRYALSVFNQINELQIYPSRLIILLEKYDKTAGQERKQTAVQIGNLVKSFDKLREEFDRVYAETRFPGNPPGYQLDSNMHHHLANGTNNSDWMFRYELSINKKIFEWLKNQ